MYKHKNHARASCSWEKDWEHKWNFLFIFYFLCLKTLKSKRRRRRGRHGIHHMEAWRRGDSSSGKLIQWFCGELFWFWHIYPGRKIVKPISCLHRWNSSFSWWSHTHSALNPKMSLQHSKLYIITKAAEERQKDWRRRSCKRTGIHQKA